MYTNLPYVIKYLHIFIWKHIFAYKHWKYFAIVLIIEKNISDNFTFCFYVYKILIILKYSNKIKWKIMSIVFRILIYKHFCFHKKHLQSTLIDEITIAYKYKYTNNT